ncbi:IclR family transcriptional regulator C-terminal domain-containing protein [Streptomyces sp. NPDC048565]|uniref:IclR family transcriptional regulator domain-containing protein n=1 Tax=Streptomyces sp. NPDC048565 TaxID=3155266 RepID=UPI003424BA5A
MSPRSSRSSPPTARRSSRAASTSSTAAPFPRSDSPTSAPLRPSPSDGPGIFGLPPEDTLADQELDQGLRAVAAPVHDRSGAVIAAADIAASAGMRSLDELRAMVPRLRECATGIESDPHRVAGP